MTNAFALVPICNRTNRVKRVVWKVVVVRSAKCSTIPTNVYQFPHVHARTKVWSLSRATKRCVQARNTLNYGELFRIVIIVEWLRNAYFPHRRSQAHAQLPRGSAAKQSVMRSPNSHPLRTFAANVWTSTMKNSPRANHRSR